MVTRNPNLFEVPAFVTARNFNSCFAKYLTWHQSIDVFDQDIFFDFRETKFIEPVAGVFFAAQEDVLRAEGYNVTVLSNDDSNLGKFLRAFGIQTKKRDSNFLDFYERNVSAYAVKVQRCVCSKDGKNVADQILPKIMQRVKCTKEVQAGLNWALYEVFDNAGVHGYECYETSQYPLPVYVCAFSYKERVEIAVLDRGQGIHKSLQPKYPGIRPKEALFRAIEDGVSGHPNGSPGFGLFGSSQIARKGNGTFNIWSSGHGIVITSESEKTFSISGFEGTMVSIGLSSGANFALQEIIGRTPDDFFEDFAVEYL